MRFGSLAIGLICVCLSTGLQAQVYKYKDEHGRWQFSDKPPVDDQAVESISVGQTKVTGLPKDLAEQLKAKFKPRSAVEEATLAVVKVESGMGTGSGFFVSDSGYLVTNRHVIRPTDYPGWQKSAQKFDKAEQKLEASERMLTRRAEQLSKMKSELDSYEDSVSRYSDREKSLAVTELEIYKERYTSMKREYDQAQQQLKAQQRKFSSQRYDFNSKSTSAKFATTFKIVLKNGDRLNARLVKESNTHDLALLKVDNHVTPYLNIALNKRVKQGMRVYAIGSPLGMNDFVTAGIITGTRSRKIVTDSQILPGNSGGPLVDSEGNALGVNTMKMFHKNVLKAEGFGLSVPIEFVLDEFSAVMR